MFVRGKIIITLIMGIILVISSAGSSNAENYDIDKKYSSTDIVTGSYKYLNLMIYGRNSYDFKLDEFSEVEYEINVIGIGSLAIFLKDEHDPSISILLMKELSTMEGVTSIHEKYKRERGEDTSKFSILVVNLNEENVTYDISIKITDNPTEYTQYIIAAVLIFFGVFILPKIVVRFMRRKEAMSKIQQTVNQYPCKSCGNLLEYIEPNKQWYCRKCNRYV